MKPFIDLAGKPIQLLTTALGRLLLGKDEPKPQTRLPTPAAQASRTAEASHSRPAKRW
jgi:hypothetical protein